MMTHSHVYERLIEEEHALVANRHLHAAVLGITIKLQRTF